MNVPVLERPERSAAFHSDDAMPVRFTVVIPAFNAEKYIAATLCSLVRQRYSALDVIVVDGASSDQTLEIVGRFSDHLHLTVISEPDCGQLDALQKGLVVARGDVTYWLNADDICMPGTLHYVADIFASQSDVDLVFSDDFAFHEASRGLFVGATIRGLNQTDHALFYRQLYSECVFWRTSRTKLLDPRYFDLRVYTDYAFFLNQNWDLKTRWVPKRLGAFRVHDAQMSKTQSERKEREFRRIRSDFYRQRGWSDRGVGMRRLVRAPAFALRQLALPFAERLGRRLLRSMTGDDARRRMAAAFFDEWLGSEASTRPLEDQLFR